MPICTFKDCTNKIFGHGYCNKHYKRWRKHGSPDIVLDSRRPKRVCYVDKCQKPCKGRGLCVSHLNRLKKYGDPTYSPSQEESVQKWRATMQERYPLGYSAPPKEKTSRRLHSTLWGKARKKVLERDGHMCQVCHLITAPLHVHHIIARSEGGSLYDEDNLISLCPSCHKKVHAVNFSTLSIPEQR